MLLTSRFSWCATNAQSDSKRAASLLLFLITGQLGSILGSNVYNDPPRYVKGNMVCAGGLFANVILAVTGIYYLKYRNKKKNEEYGPPNPQAVVEQRADGKDDPNWRFVY